MFKRRLYSGHSFGHRPRFRLWLRQHKKAVIPGALALLILLGAGGVALYKYFKKDHTTPPAVAKKEEKKEETPPPPKFYSPLTGLEVSKEQSERPVTAIMIENSPDARPQSGVINAGVVFEAIAEGGITRYLCLYQEMMPGLIGPVRSLRPYYLDWAAAFDPSIVHVGGSANALTEVRSGKYKDADQFFNGGYFWRATDRYAPHNVYTSGEKMDQLNQAKGYAASTFTAFRRKAAAPSPTPNATKINVDVSGPLYNSAYNYDTATNTYYRFLNGKPDNNREGGQIHPNVVIVLKIPHTLVYEDGYRESLTTIGSGEAVIFQDGAFAPVTWNKADKKSQITFTDVSGAPVKLNPGITWITAIPTNKSVTWQ